MSNNNHGSDLKDSITLWFGIVGFLAVSLSAMVNAIVKNKPTQWVMLCGAIIYGIAFVLHRIPERKPNERHDSPGVR